MKPTLGILITYHNERELLHECLDSLMAQTVPPDEILLYDDASEHPPGPYIPAGCPIRITHGETNQGPSHGRNILLNLSRSDYIHFHDADDWFRPTWCERVRQAIADGAVDMILTNIAAVRDDRLVSGRLLPLEKLEEINDLLRYSLRHDGMFCSAITLKRYRAIATGGFRDSLHIAEDWDFYLRVAMLHVTFVAIDDALAIRRLRPNSLSADADRAGLAIVKVLDTWVDKLPAEYRSDAIDMMVDQGSMLLRRGKRMEAREVFRLAYAHGRPTFRHRHRRYRQIANRWGPEVAERLLAVYRTLTLEPLRHAFSEWVD